MAGVAVRADPIDLTRLAGQLLLSSQRIADGWRAARPAVVLPPGAWGDTPTGNRMAAGHAGTVDEFDVLLGRLVGVLEVDTDRLYRVAFAYQSADGDAAGRIPVTPV